MPEPSSIDGFGIINDIAMSIDFNIPIERTLIPESRASLPNDFTDYEWSMMNSCIRNMEVFLLEMQERYGSPIYNELLDEFYGDLEHFLEINGSIIDNGSFPTPYSPYLTKCNRFLNKTVIALKEKGSTEYKSNIVLLELCMRSIKVIESGIYNRIFFLGELYKEHSNTPKETNDIQQDTNGTQDNKEDKKSSSNGDCPDFADEIKTLEDDLSHHKPAFKIEEYNPQIDYAKELNKLIGLESLKKQLETFMDNFKLQSIRQKEHPDLKLDTSYNCIFKGKPGTGKTTVARLVAGLLRQNGILKGGRCVEVDASSLVSGWIGFSPKITTLAALKAIDGVLFIDEAYALMNNFANSNGAGPGKEVIDALTPIMENNRNRLLVIIAGYDKEMDEFISASNTGFPSRFKNVMQFEDYTADEMTKIFLGMVKSNFYEINEEGIHRIHLIFEFIYRQINLIPTFANARTVRNVFDLVRERASQRMLKSAANDYDTLTIQDVSLTPDEIKRALGIF